MIEIKNLTKHYIVNQRTVRALNEVNLTIRRGEIFGIFGVSGAGKTSLLRSINLLDRPTAGEVYVDGTNILTLTSQELRQYRRQVGMIFQQFNLLESRTAFENIALPLELLKKSKPTIQSEVGQLLDWIHLEKHQHHYPRELSGGQKQRVAIARALITQPKMLLSDEATSALDPRSTLSILRLLKKINRELGVTIVLITHEMEVIKSICDAAAVIDQGKVLESGSVIDLFASPQTHITRQLVQKALHLELPEIIQSRLQHEPHPYKSPLVSFTFVGDDSAQPFLSNLVQQFQITLNIIQANIEVVQARTIGFTICTLHGNAEKIEQALQSIHSKTITVQRLGYV